MGGKTEMQMLMLEFALRRGDKAVILTNDQAEAIRRVNQFIPGALCVIEQDGVVRPVLRKAK